MEVNKLKNIINNDVLRLTDSIEAIQNTTDDILQELTKSIGQIDFMLLAYPESTDVLKQYKALETKLNVSGTLSDEDQILFKDLTDKLKRFKLSKNHFLILCIEQLLKIAISKGLKPSFIVINDDITLI